MRTGLPKMSQCSVVVSTWICNRLVFSLENSKSEVATCFMNSTSIEFWWLVVLGEIPLLYVSPITSLTCSLLLQHCLGHKCGLCDPRIVL